MTPDTSSPFTSALHAWTGAFMRRSVHDMQQFSRQSGLSMAQFSTLMHLYHQGACGVSDIGSHLGVTNAAASQLIDRLVGLGYLERSEDPADRRVRQIAVTGSGSRLIESAIAARHRWMEELTGSLSPVQQQLIIEALTLLTQAAGQPKPTATPQT